MIDVAACHERPRVLQLSYACSPVRGSEAGVGWHRAVQSARDFDTWVICEEHEFAGEIRRYLETHGEIPGLHFIFVPINQREWAFGNLHHVLWYAVLRRWHRKAFHVARRLHARIHFDLVHQVTFCGYREPSYLWELDAPFVWGPIGGTQNYPWRFLACAGIRGALKEGCRSVMNRLQLHWSRRVSRAARQAAVVLAANSTNQRDFSRAHAIALPILSDVGINALAGTPCRRNHPGPLRLLWSGHLHHHKALHLLIHALAGLPESVAYELRVLGDGPLRARWRKLAEKTHVANHTLWLGRLPYHEAIAQYTWADVFIFSSLRDTAGMVLVEALRAGLPVVCLDHQGAHDIVTDACGVRVPVTTPAKVIAGLREAVVRLAADETLRHRLGQGGIERARDYLWSVLGDRMSEVYRRVATGGRRASPRDCTGSSHDAQPLPSLHPIPSREHQLGTRMAPLRSL